MRIRLIKYVERPPAVVHGKPRNWAIQPIAYGLGVELDAEPDGDKAVATIHDFKAIFEPDEFEDITHENDGWTKVLCPCGHELGFFDSEDDHSGVIMRCPACRKAIYVANQMIGDEDCYIPNTTTPTIQAEPYPEGD